MCAAIVDENLTKRWALLDEAEILEIPYYYLEEGIKRFLQDRNNRIGLTIGSLSYTPKLCSSRKPRAYSLHQGLEKYIGMEPTASLSDSYLVCYLWDTFPRFLDEDMHQGKDNYGRWVMCCTWTH